MFVIRAVGLRLLDKPRKHERKNWKVFELNTGVKGTPSLITCTELTMKDVWNGCHSSYKQGNKLAKTLNIWEHKRLISKTARIYTYIMKKSAVIFHAPSLVIYWSELLANNHEVPGLIPGSIKGIFFVGGISVVTMVWVVSRFRLKVETSSTKSQKSIYSDWTHKRSPRWRGPHHVRDSTS